MKRHSIFLVVLMIVGCALPYHKRRHSETPYITKGMYSLFKSIGTITRKAFNAKMIAKGFPYVLNATMPADEFIDTAAIFKNKLVSYSARVESGDTDLIRFNWDYDPSHFNGSTPVPLLFPYPHDADHINNRYYVKFIPVADFQKKRLDHIWDNSALIPGIKLQDIQYLSRGGMERPDGYIAKTYPQLYHNPFSALGIKLLFYMTDGTKIECYMITSDMFDNNSPHYVRWKIKI